VLVADFFYTNLASNIHTKRKQLGIATYATLIIKISLLAKNAAIFVFGKEEL